MSNSESDEYYYPCVKDYREMKPRAAIEEWLESTEPTGSRPTHTRILNTDVAEMTIQKFLMALRIAVLSNSKFGWKIGQPLPGKNRKKQPLADDNR